MAELRSPRAPDPVVSFDDEPLILVDSNDREIGCLDKAAAHDGAGRLHRAFSIFLFNSSGELLLQQRAAGKRLWPDYWANTCCSHPRRGESMIEATARRLREELGLESELEYLFKFEYQAHFGTLGSEHELCHVFAGRSDAVAVINQSEIAALRYLSPAALDAELTDAPERFTPWLHLEWERLRREHPRWLGA